MQYVEETKEEPGCSHDDGHKWAAPHALVGGLRENPGVWSEGANVYEEDVCIHCGCARVRGREPNEFGPPTFTEVYAPGRYCDEVEALKQESDDDQADDDGHAPHDCVKCECGDWSGEPCPWSGLRGETVLVRYVPGQYRGTATALGGGVGHGLAQTLRVHENCAEHMHDHDPEWVEIIE